MYTEYVIMCIDETIGMRPSIIPLYTMLCTLYRRNIITGFITFNPLTEFDGPFTFSAALFMRK